MARAMDVEGAAPFVFLSAEERQAYRQHPKCVELMKKADAALQRLQKEVDSAKSNVQRSEIDTGASGQRTECVCGRRRAVVCGI